MGAPTPIPPEPDEGRLRAAGARRVVAGVLPTVRQDMDEASRLAVNAGRVRPGAHLLGLTDAALLESVTADTPLLTVAWISTWRRWTRVPTPLSTSPTSSVSTEANQEIHENSPDCVPTALHDLNPKHPPPSEALSRLTSARPPPSPTAHQSQLSPGLRMRVAALPGTHAQPAAIHHPAPTLPPSSSSSQSHQVILKGIDRRGPLGHTAPNRSYSQ